MTVEDLLKIIELLKTDNTKDISAQHVGKYVIVRTYSAGVFFGKLKEMSGKQCVLDECRRIYSWSKAFTLSHAALYGIGDDSKLTDETTAHVITEAIEVIPATSKAVSVFKNIKTHQI